jgi:hypothetical protein
VVDADHAHFVPAGCRHQPELPTVTLTGVDTTPLATAYRLLGPVSILQGTVKVAVLVTSGATEFVVPIVLA